MTETRPVVLGDAPGERDRADAKPTGGSAGRDGGPLMRQGVDVAEIEAHDLSASLADLAGLVTGTMGLG